MTRLRCMPCALLLLILALLPEACEARVVAIVIGIDQYNDTKIRPLAGAVNDAVAMARVLMAQCGAHAADVHLLVTKSGSPSPETVPKGLALVEPTLTNIQNA